ncbi:CISD2 isoform 3 [Pongo abelii]|uniref:CISD2 isoform 3 n=1 Tax=Pongo abelii TaxID=9601 RepID=A0A2J8XQQ2_PONAB|nr:CISD2 isoform 3 [Pongo abelii]
MVLESVARIVKVQLPAYLKRLPVPESITGFAKLTESCSCCPGWSAMA